MFVVVLGLAAGGCGRERPPDVLVVTFDTTRADRLGCYGYEEPTSPVIDSLAAESYVFDNAFTTHPITLPAHTSIFTGTYPLAHGVRNNSSYRVREGVTTLAEILSSRGYQTAAVVGAFVLDSQFNLDQGFDHYDDDVGRDWSRDEIASRQANAFGFAERKANLVTRAALDWIETAGDQPFFLWLHYFDPHEPRNAPEPHSSRFVDPYDAEVAFADEQVGKVFDALRERRRWQNTMVAFLADHGEGLLQHSEPTHSLRIFDSTMRVPWVLRVPGRPGGRRISDLVSVIDVLPTILELLGIESPAEVQGISVAARLDDDRPQAADADDERQIYMESLVARLDYGWGELRGLRTPREKLIHGPKPRYYQVGEDPGEVYDRANQEPAAVERLTRDLARKMSRLSVPEALEAAAALDPDTLGKLVSLGYVGGTQGGASREITDRLEPGSERADPHEKGHLFDLYAVAVEYLRVEDTERGIRELRGILATDPEFAAAMTSLGAAYLVNLRQPERAKEILERSLAIEPNQASAHFYLSQIASVEGDAEKVRRHAEAILSFEAHHFGALFQLGHYYTSTNDLERAAEHFDLAREIVPDHVGNLMALSGTLMRLGRLEEAGAPLRAALEIEPLNSRLLFLVSVWYLEGDDPVRARQFLERTVTADPTHGRAFVFLARLLVNDGEMDAARQALDVAEQLPLPPVSMQEAAALRAALDG